MADWDYANDRRVRWGMVVVGLILLLLGIYLNSTRPKIGEPIKTEKKTLGNTTTVTRYWKTEDEIKLAQKDKEIRDSVWLSFLFSGILVFFGIKGLIRINKKSSNIEMSNNNGFPIDAGKIKIYPSSFSYKNEMFDIGEIKHISFHWIKYFSQGFKDARGLEGARMKMSIQTRRSSQNISSEVSTSYRHESTEFSKFINGHKHLASVTFTQRYNSYVDELNRNGYFRYDNKKIFKNGNVEWRIIKLNLFKNKVFKEPFVLVIDSGKNFIETWKWNFRHPFLPRDITINTEMDQDVFFELLKNVFKIHWPP